MANEIQRKYRTSVTAQASAAITADTDSTGTQTALDNTPTGNGGGCEFLRLMLDVTAAPSAEAKAEIYMAESDDDSNYTNYVLIKTVTVPAATGKHKAGAVFFPAKYTQYKIKAIDYGFTASLAAWPQLPEVQ